MRHIFAIKTMPKLFLKSVNISQNYSPMYLDLDPMTFIYE